MSLFNGHSIIYLQNSYEVDPGDESQYEVDLGDESQSVPGSVPQPSRHKVRPPKPPLGEDSCKSNNPLKPSNANILTPGRRNGRESCRPLVGTEGLRGRLGTGTRRGSTLKEVESRSFSNSGRMRILETEGENDVEKTGIFSTVSFQRWKFPSTFTLPEWIH